MRDDAAQHRDAVVPFARIFVGELGAAPVAAASGVREKCAARIPHPAADVRVFALERLSAVASTATR